MLIQQPPVDTEWVVEQAHQVNHPKTINSDTLFELRSRLRALAGNVPEHARHVRPYGPLEFRYECDEDDVVTRVHAYFIGHNGHRRRFMKLRRNSHA